MKIVRSVAFLLAFFCLCIWRLAADPAKVVVHFDQPCVNLSPDFYGLMTEEINHSYDGGLYAELIQNRSFKDNPDYAVHWSLIQPEGCIGELHLSDDAPVSPALSKTLEITIGSVSDGQIVGAANDGFWGIPVRPHTKYHASFYAEASDGYSGPLTVALQNSNGSKVFASGVTSQLTSNWQLYQLDLVTGAVEPSTSNRFVISGGHIGTVRLSLVSLFPPTYNNRPNGNRVDLMQELAALKPAFLRFPGGNFVDPGHYEWKTTIGPLVDRPGGPGDWGYHVSDGLGILEFFEWCEDLHMEPILDVTDGRGWLPGDGDEAPLVQDALDEIEYATGSATSTWGSKRVADGHPAPFPLKYIEIGNEDFFDSREVYNSRFAQFFDAIRTRYPQLIIIATRDDVTSRVPDMVDDHFYHDPQGMEAIAHYYDHYDRSKPKIFVGEWRTSNLQHFIDMGDTLGDAAWLIGLERNADVVKLECYAPLFFNVNPDAYHTPANLIGYDSDSVFGTPSYYMQKMFANGHGDEEAKVDVITAGATTPSTAPTQGAIGVGSWRNDVEYRDIEVRQGEKVLYRQGKSSSIEDWKRYYGNWSENAGVIAQIGNVQNCIASSGKNACSDYTLTLQGRKLDGGNGLYVYVRYNGPNDCIRWRVSDRGDEPAGLDDISNGFISTLTSYRQPAPRIGQWYTLKVRVHGNEISCYQDNILVAHAVDTHGKPAQVIFASASRDSKTGDVWLHLVNISASTQKIDLSFPGLTTLSAAAKGELLTGELASHNTIDYPTAVVPKQILISDVARSFQYSASAHSITVLELRSAPSNQ